MNKNIMNLNKPKSHRLHVLKQVFCIQFKVKLFSLILKLFCRSFCLKTGVQILLREYVFDSKNRLTFFEEDIINIFPVVKHINPRVSTNTTIFLNTQH